MTRSVCQCHVRLGPRPDGFYSDAERDAFVEKQTKALTKALDYAKSRPAAEDGRIYYRPRWSNYKEI